MDYLYLLAVILAFGAIAVGLRQFTVQAPCLLTDKVQIVRAVYTANQGPLSHLPGPWYTKFTSWPIKLHFLRGNGPRYVHRLHQNYGPTVRVAPDQADICDISAKQTIYSTKEVFLKSLFYRGLTAGNDVNVFATQNIEKHRYFRRALSGPMSETSLKVVEPIVRSRIDLAIQRMADSMKTTGFVDVSLWTLLMATDIIGELTFGESFRTLEAGTKSQYINDLKNTGEAGSWLYVFGPFLSLTRRIGIPTPIPFLNSAFHASQRLNRYSEQSLARYHRLIEDDPVNIKPTLFTKLFKAEEEETLTFPEMINNARAYLVAGSDTTAHTLTYLIWSVCKSPQIRDRLVAELTSRLPSDLDTFSDSDLRELPYLDRVIEETLRLYSAASSALPRIVPPRGAELAGYWFPAGVTVSSQAYSLHRDPATHPDPETFDPDRWDDEKVTRNMKDANMAWGAGSRGIFSAVTFPSQQYTNFLMNQFAWAST